MNEHAEFCTSCFWWYCYACGGALQCEKYLGPGNQEYVDFHEEYGNDVKTALAPVEAKWQLRFDERSQSDCLKS